MTRFFYSDPLAAAWMAREFGMTFNDWPIRAVKDILSFAGDRFYLHPESLHLLEPHIGDMISHLGMRAWRIDGMDDRTYTHPPIGPESIGRFTFKSDNPRIIQRDGKPFFWPEAE